VRWRPLDEGDGSGDVTEAYVLRRGDASSGRVRLADQFHVSSDAAGGHRLQGGNVIKTFLTIFVINAQGPVL